MPCQDPVTGMMCPSVSLEEREMSLPPAMPTKDIPFPLLGALRARSGHPGKEAERSGSC